MHIQTQKTFFLNGTFWLFQRLSNGSIDPDSDVTRVIELQDTVEKQNTELTSSRTRVLELTNRCTELEESLNTAQKDLSKAQEQLVKLQRDLREVSFPHISSDLMVRMKAGSVSGLTTPLSSSSSLNYVLIVSLTSLFIFTH